MDVLARTLLRAYKCIPTYFTHSCALYARRLPAEAANVYDNICNIIIIIT